MKAGITITVGSRTVDLTDARYEELTYWLDTLDTKAKKMIIRRLVHRIRGVTSRERNDPEPAAEKSAGRVFSTSPFSSQQRTSAWTSQITREVTSRHEHQRA